MRFAILTTLIAALSVTATPIPVDSSAVAVRGPDTLSQNLAERGTTTTINAGQYAA